MTGRHRQNGSDQGKEVRGLSFSQMVESHECDAVRNWAVNNVPSDGIFKKDFATPRRCLAIRIRFSQSERHRREPLGHCHLPV